MMMIQMIALNDRHGWIMIQMMKDVRYICDVLDFDFLSVYVIV